MPVNKSPFILPKRINTYLSTLSELYKKSPEDLRLVAIVNGMLDIREGWDYDNWNGGTTGHAVIFTLPKSIYVRLHGHKDVLQEQVLKDLNSLHNVPDETFAALFIEPQTDESDWRRDSGALQLPHVQPPEDAVSRLWSSTSYRVFISHKSQVKAKASLLKIGLDAFGISAFVAHSDIKATRKWQDEIQYALSSMDAFVALLTPGFHDSKWTDQEVGFAVARQVPLISIRLGSDPYGFIGQFQALSCDWGEAPLEIAKLLMVQARMVDAYISRLHTCNTYEEGLRRSQLLLYIKLISLAQADRMAEEVNRDSQLKFCWGFNGAKPSVHGPGLAHYLSQATGAKYIVASDGDVLRKDRP